MTYEERRTRVVSETADPVPGPPTNVEERRGHVAEPRTHVDHPVVSDRVVSDSSVSVIRPSGSTMAARIVALIFGLIQLVIGLRILFLLLNAREGNALVAGVLDLSRPLVAPFEGIFQTNALQAGGSVLDIAAIVALVGWTVLELIILAVMRIPRPGEDV
jgi:hypothetical protein